MTYRNPILTPDTRGCVVCDVDTGEWVLTDKTKQRYTQQQYNAGAVVWSFEDAAGTTVTLPAVDIGSETRVTQDTDLAALDATQSPWTITQVSTDWCGVSLECSYERQPKCVPMSFIPKPDFAGFTDAEVAQWVNRDAGTYTARIQAPPLVTGCTVTLTNDQGVVVYSASNVDATTDLSTVGTGSYAPYMSGDLTNGVVVQGRDAAIANGTYYNYHDLIVDTAISPSGQFPSQFTAPNGAVAPDAAQASGTPTDLLLTVSHPDCDDATYMFEWTGDFTTDMQVANIWSNIGGVDDTDANKINDNNQVVQTSGTTGDVYTVGSMTAWQDNTFPAADVGQAVNSDGTMVRYRISGNCPRAHNNSNAIGGGGGVNASEIDLNGNASSYVIPDAPESYPEYGSPRCLRKNAAGQITGGYNYALVGAAQIEPTALQGGAANGSDYCGSIDLFRGTPCSHCAPVEITVDDGNGNFITIATRPVDVW